MTMHKMCLAISLASFSLMSACSQTPSGAAETATSSSKTELNAAKHTQSGAAPSANPGNEGDRSAMTVSDDNLLRPSFAECADKSGGITPEMQACMETEYQFHDARLKAAYQSLLQMQDAAGRKSIEQSQMEWLSNKNKKCAWDAQHEGQAQRLEADYCNMRSTAKRANDLEKTLNTTK